MQPYLQVSPSQSQSRSPSRTRPARRASSESRAPWLTAVRQEGVEEKFDKGMEKCSKEVQKVLEEQEELQAELATLASVVQEEVQVFSDDDSVSVTLELQAEGEEEKKGRVSGVRFDLNQNVGCLESEDSGSDFDDGSDIENESDGEESCEDTSTEEETDGECEERMSDTDSSEDDDWSPPEADLEVLQEDIRAEEEIVIRGVRAGCRGKLYAECETRQGKWGKVKKMKAANDDHDLNVAFAKDVLKDEKKPMVEEECDEISMSRVLAALSLVKTLKLSRSQYLNLKYWLESRAQLGEDNFSLPSWNQVTTERKKALPEKWPAEGEATATEARIGLQELIDTTTKRYWYLRLSRLEKGSQNRLLNL